MSDRESNNITAKCNALLDQNLAYLREHKRAELFRICMHGPDGSEEDAKLIRTVFTQFNFMLFSIDPNEEPRAETK